MNNKIRENALEEVLYHVKVEAKNCESRIKWEKEKELKGDPFKVEIEIEKKRILEALVDEVPKK